MKKLLFVTALLAMGTMAMGAAPAKGDKASANVEVRARIVDDNFIISDIYGKEIVLNFGDLFSSQKKSAVTYVDYKVTAKDAAGEPGIGFDITLGGKNAATDPTEVVISTDNDVNAAKTDSMKANLVLSEYVGRIEKAKTEYRGRINGTISVKELENKSVGVYTGNTKLEITVQ